jgi:DNA-binding NarL/FixJ family response regulator
MSLPRVLIADDHMLFAEGLAQLLSGRFEVVGKVCDGSQVADAVEKLHPDVVLLDVSMPRVSGLDVLRQLKTRRAAVRAVVLTMHGDARLAVEALKAGAAGFVLKESSGDQLLTALDAVLQGRTYLTSTLTGEVLSLLSGQSEPATVKLTARQRDVLRLIVDGKRVKEVAELLELSPRTVEAIKYQMMQDLNVHSTATLVRYAIQHDLMAF